MASDLHAPPARGFALVTGWNDQGSGAMPAPRAPRANLCAAMLGEMRRGDLPGARRSTADLGGPPQSTGFVHHTGGCQEQAPSIGGGGERRVLALLVLWAQVGSRSVRPMERRRGKRYDGSGEQIPGCARRPDSEVVP